MAGTPAPWTRRLAVLALVLSLAAILMGLGAAAGPLQFRRMAGSVPPIHDITTDTEDPPRDLAPLVLTQPPPAAFERIRAAAQEMGFEIVDADAAQGRVDATDTTWWFGFKDDVVVRLHPQGAGTRVDVRSLSRVGRSDVGANARRIRRFLAALRGE